MLHLSAVIATAAFDRIPLVRATVIAGRSHGERAPSSAPPVRLSMPARHGGKLAKNANTSLRLLPGDDDLTHGIDAVGLAHLLCKVESDVGNSCL